MTTSQNESAGDMLHSLDEDKGGEPSSQLQMRFSRESAENNQSQPDERADEGSRSGLKRRSDESRAEFDESSESESEEDQAERN